MQKTLETALRLGVVCGVANFLTAARFVVEGDSMEPGFAHGDYLLVSRLAYRFCSPRRGDAVVLHDPGQPDRDCLKRVVGLRGERVRCQDGRVWINDEPLEEPYVKKQALPQGSIQEWLLGCDEYAVLGDRRDNSRDSRAFGPVRRELIVGRAWLRYWPWVSWGLVPRQHYALKGDTL